MTEQTKKCSCCKKIKPLSEYYKRGTCSSEVTVRYRSHCKECTSLKSAVRWETNEEFKNRGKNNAYKYNIKKNYGITEEQYLKIYAEQNGLCAICAQKSQSKSGRLALDHCHKTGIVRGLLCTKCNAGIGMLKDDINLLTSAVLYLKRYSNV
jgi:hypothetical protein